MGEVGGPSVHASRDGSLPPRHHSTGKSPGLIANHVEAAGVGSRRGGSEPSRDVKGLGPTQPLSNLFPTLSARPAANTHGRSALRPAHTSRSDAAADHPNAARRGPFESRRSRQRDT